MIKKQIKLVLVFLITMLLGEIMSTIYAASQKLILIADPRVLNIPIHENHERFINLTQQSVIAYGPPLKPLTILTIRFYEKRSMRN